MKINPFVLENPFRLGESDVSEAKTTLSHLKSSLSAGGGDGLEELKNTRIVSFHPTTLPVKNEDRDPSEDRPTLSKYPPPSSAVPFLAGLLSMAALYTQ